MTSTDQLKTIDNRIKASQAQYNVDRLAAIIFEKSSNELGKYELLMAEDLGYKTSLTEQAKFDYSPLGKVFNKGLGEEDKKEGLLISVKNIGDKNDKLLKAIEEKNKKQLKAIENQGKKQLDSNEKNNQLKDDRTTSIVLIKDGLEELIKSYPTSFSTLVKNELKHLATKEKILTTKNCLKIFFLMALVF